MLFNSYPFIFLFLPITLIGYFVLVRLNHLAPVIWLALASLVFYSVSNWQFVLLLVASIAFNYVIGLLLISKRPRPAWRVAALTIGVAGSVRDPGAVAGTQHRLERGDQTAGGHERPDLPASRPRERELYRPISAASTAPRPRRNARGPATASACSPPGACTPR